jgi:excisionase family DNA binding protein
MSNLLTVPETADLLRLRISTIRAWLLRRRLPYLKIGRSVRIRREDVEKLLASAFVPARPEDKQ